MNPYGKTSNWFCRRKERCDTSPINGKTTPSLLRLDSTGNTVCKRDLHTSIPKSMASCLAKTIGGFTTCRSSQPQDSSVGCMSEFPILQNIYKDTCDSDMAAKNFNSMTKPVRPETSCVEGFHGLAGCLGMNACSSISQHHSNFRVPYIAFHPAIVHSFPQNSESAKKQYSKCQSQRTGKKSNRYFRYGWNSPQRKHSPDGERVVSQKPQVVDVNKKQKCEHVYADQKVEKQKRHVESVGQKKIEAESKCSDIESKDCISSPLSNLSLGESVAIKNALNQCSVPCSNSTDAEKQKPDWFNINRSDSDNKLSPSNTATVLDNWDDEISAEIQSENFKLQEDILDLLVTEDEKKKLDNGAKVTDTTGSTDDSIRSPDNNCETDDSIRSPDNNYETMCISRVKLNDSESHSVENATCQNNEPPAVLYLRNMNKKGRPSHKKRSRRKGSKHSKSFSGDQGQKRKFEDGKSAKSGACAIALIIGGLGPEFSLDSDSDLSFDSDEDSSESVEDDIDFMCHFSNPLLTNVLCSVKPSSIQCVSQAVSDANRAWQINLQETKTTTTATSSGDKKVFFLV